MHRLVILVLRACLLGAFVVGLFGQTVVIPTTAADEVDQFPPYAPYAAPYVAVAVVGVACVQAVLVATWMLLGMVRRGAIFTPRAFRWVDVTIVASVVATLLSLGVAGHLLLAPVPSPTDGMDLLGALGGALVCAVVGAAFALLVGVLRGLLRKAIEMRAELSEVV